MNRWLMVVMMGLVVGGCAEGVEDPLPESDSTVAATAPAPEAPSKTLFGGQFDMITENQALGLGAKAPAAPVRPNEALPPHAPEELHPAR